MTHMIRATLSEWIKLGESFRRVGHDRESFVATWISDGQDVEASELSLVTESVFSSGGVWSVAGDGKDEFLVYAGRAGYFLGYSMEAGDSRGDHWLRHLVATRAEILNLESGPEFAHLKGETFRVRSVGFIDDVCNVSALACEILANSGMPTTEPPGRVASSVSMTRVPQTQNAEQVTNFIAAVVIATGEKVRKADFWRVAGYSDDTQFSLWQRESPEASFKSNTKFAKVLRMSPDDFIEERNRAVPRK